MLTTYMAGAGLGLALISPIGPQNMFVLNAGFTVGVPRVFAVTVATTLCDAFLIVLGTLGAGALLEAVPVARLVLLAFGVVFLTYLGVRGMRAAVPDPDPSAHLVGRRLFGQVAAVSLLNPHAILDTVGVIGSAAAAQPAGLRSVFAFGAVSASLLWFVVLGAGAAAISSRLSPRVRIWIQRGSAAVILAFAVVLLVELVATPRFA